MSGGDQHAYAWHARSVEHRGDWSVQFHHVSEHIHAQHRRPGTAHQPRLESADHGDRGGAVVPELQGMLADHIGVQHAFVLPLLCYLYIVFYGFRGSKLDVKAPLVAQAEPPARA